MADFNEYKGVWVFCEQRQGALMSTDFELVSEARKLADELGCEVTGLLLGDNVEGIAKELGGYGADKVMVCDSPLLKDYTTDAYAKVVCDMVNEYKPEVLLIGATNIGRDLGPRCAARLHTGLTADATHLDIDTAKYIDFLKESSTIDLSKQKFDMEDRNLKMTRPAFGGHLMATIICPRFRPQMSTVRPGVMKKAPFDQAKADACQIVKPAFSLTAEDIKTEVLSVEKAAEKLVDLIGADVIVSVGRGISKDVNPRSMWLWVSPVPSSTPPVCRIPSASSPSTRTRVLPSSVLLTTASWATCSRSFPSSSSRSRQQRLLCDQLP